VGSRLLAIGGFFFAKKSGDQSELWGREGGDWIRGTVGRQFREGGDWFYSGGLADHITGRDFVGGEGEEFLRGEENMRESILTVKCMKG